MDVELQATCSALGYTEGKEYVKEPDCLETVKDLIRFLRRDTDICDIRRQLGHAQIVQNDLIPLVKFYHKDKALFETVIKLLVNLTQPVVTCWNNQIPDEKTLRNYCLEVESYLQDYKEAFIDEDFFNVLSEKIMEILKLDWDELREEDKLQLERLFILIRNILLIPADPSREQRTEDDASTHDQVLWTMHTSGVEDLILFVASSERERSMLCMHVLEIISLMFKEQETATLASAGVERSTTEKIKDQKELEHAREKERALKKSNILKFSARHSRFGGTYVIKNMKSISENDVIYHKSLGEAKTFSYDDNKNPKKKAKNRAPIKGDEIKRRSTLSMRLSLKQFCVQFLVNAYNPLMRSVKDALTRKTAQDNDETYYLWAMRFFMEFCRLNCKRVDLVGETMSLPAFHYIYTQLLTYYENIRLGKGEEVKTWGRRTHVALKAYQELLRTLDFMSKSNDRQLQESAKVVQSNVFYMIEYRDIFITLLKNFNESKSSRAFLRDLVESTHVFLKMLETFTKSSKLVVQKKKKSIKKKKKAAKSSSAGSQNQQLSEEELETLWNSDLSEELNSVLQGQQDLPEGVTPFDAASDVSMDDQRVEAMLRVQENLREKNVGLAVALFRSAREVWPERDEFGTEGMSQEEEFLALKEVFMANLPRPQRLADVEEDEEEEETNEIEEEERQEVQRSETEFDFKTFLHDFAHQDIVKAYGILLAEFTTNSDLVNHCVVKMLHRLSHDLGYVGMLFQASIFKSFNSLLNGIHAGLSRYKELSKFACYVIRQFTAIAKNNPKVFVDIMFWKNKTESLAITGGYDFENKSKAKMLWTEDQEQELLFLYEKYKDTSHPEKDVVDLILGDLTSSHTRVQVLKELKRQGLITSAKDIKKKGKTSRAWSEEEIQELKDLYEQFKDSDYPISEILKLLPDGKSKNAVIGKLLELKLIEDRREVLKKRKGRNRRRHEDSSEGEMLFPEEGNIRRGRSSDESNASDSSEDENDEDGNNEEHSRLSNGGSRVSVIDQIKGLAEKGYRNQLAWMQRGLRSAAEDRDEGVCVPTPIVPLTEENETAMEDEVFLAFLRTIGISSPVGEQEVFWRIPAEFSATELRQIADGLELSEEGEVLAREIEKIVSKHFPTSSPSAANREKKKKLKPKKDKSKLKTDRKKPVRKPRQKKNNDDFINDKDGHDSSGNDRSLSDSDEDIPKKAFVMPKVVKGSDTSDSGLDPEIERREQEKIQMEKNQKRKSSHRVTEERRNALKRMLERKNERKKRITDDTDSRDPASKETKKKSPTKDVDNESSSQATINKSPKSDSSSRKKKATIQSDSDSDTSSLSSLSHDSGDDTRLSQPDGSTQASSQASDDTRLSQADGTQASSQASNDTRLSQQEGSTQSNSQATPVSAKSKKRFLQSGSESDSNNGADEAKGGKSSTNKRLKRIRVVSSDEDSEKENTDKMDDDDKGLSSQKEESFKLLFSGSDDEGGDRTEDRQSERTESEPVGKSADSFPATLFTQGVDSDDEEDDHISLRTAMKRKRAIIEDDDDD